MRLPKVELTRFPPIEGIFMWGIQFLAILLCPTKIALKFMTKAKELPPLEVLEARFSYDPETGTVTYKNTINPRAKQGQVVGWINNTGYLIVQIEKSEYLLHRIIYALYHKQNLLPDDVIDHSNQVVSDNRIVNLRKVKKSGNNYNRPLLKSNTSGHRGVYFNNSKSKWVAKLGGKQIGCFNTKEEAIFARLSMETRQKVFISQ